MPLILLGAAHCLACSLALGNAAIDLVRLRLRNGEKPILAFIVGSALLSDIVFMLTAAGCARRSWFLAVTAIALTACLWARRHAVPADPVKPVPRLWIAVMAVSVAAYAWFYLANAMAPEVSSDGIHYHLALVARYARIHGFERITTNFYASFSQGLEMLFLVAFSVGKHSAAALVHCAFLFALALAMLRYSQRYGLSVAGVCGALLTFAAPVVGIDAISAYNDVAAACVAFIAFYFLRIWMDEPDLRFVALAGLCAGFAYAIKYSAGLTIVYCLGLICLRASRGGRHMLRTCAVFLLFVSISVVPWMVKNWIYVRNPVAPFCNRLFPNPYVTPDFEDELREGLRHWNQLQLADMPLEVTVRGYRANGFFGWAFLLAPIGLFALRNKEGRYLMIGAIVFTLPVLANKGARFLIPAVPFYSLAMGMVLARLPLFAATVVLAHTISSWPPVLNKYCHPWSWRLEHAPWAAALRITPEERYIATRIGEYPVSRMLETRVPAGVKIFSFQPIAQSYCAREVIVAWWGAENLVLRDTLQLPVTQEYCPMWRRAFRFHARCLYGIRILETARGTAIWRISELRLMRHGSEVPWRSAWRTTANPSPWNAGLAVDGLALTCWRANQALFSGMFFEITFGGSRRALDSLMLDCPNNQSQVRLLLQGETAPGRWETIANSSELSEVSPALDLRLAATAEVKRSGIPYILIPPGSFIERDVRSAPGAWDLIPVDNVAGWYLYRIF